MAGECGTTWRAERNSLNVSWECNYLLLFPLGSSRYQASNSHRNGTASVTEVISTALSTVHYARKTLSWQRTTTDIAGQYRRQFGSPKMVWPTIGGESYRGEMGKSLKAMDLAA